MKRVLAAARGLTTLGRIVLAASIVAAVAGLVGGWIEAVDAGLTGLLATALAALFTVGRTSLDVRLQPERRRLTAGEQTTVTVMVTNVAPRRAFGFTLEVARGAGVEAFAVPGLPAASTSTFVLPVSAPRRGIIPVGPATSVRGDPFGLVQRRYRWAEPTELIVHPAIVRLGATGTGLLRDLEGRTSDDVSMSDLAFQSLREYVPGDDRRHIHWRSTAKTGTFLVRQFQDTRRTCLLLVVDTDAAAYGEEEEPFETAVSVAASIAARAVVDAVDVALFAGTAWSGIDPARRRDRQHVLDLCARAHLGGAALPRQVTRAARAVPEATYAMVVTGAQPAFAALRRACTQLPPAMPVAAVRIQPGAQPRRTAYGALEVLTLPALADLPGLLR